LRIQKKNFYDYSWKSNPNAIQVCRPSKYGNPFKIVDYGLETCLQKYEEWLREHLTVDPEFLEPLRGKDLVCYCHLDKPCHADIILKLLSEVSK